MRRSWLFLFAKTFGFGSTQTIKLLKTPFSIKIFVCQYGDFDFSVIHCLVAEKNCIGCGNSNGANGWPFTSKKSLSYTSRL